MAMIIKRIGTGFFHGKWSLLTTINGGLAGMVKDKYIHTIIKSFHAQSQIIGMWVLKDCVYCMAYL